MKTSNRYLLGGWAALVGLGAGLGLLTRLPMGALLGLIVGTIASFAVAAVRRTWVRAALEEIGLRWLLALHLVRFVGGYFLWLESEGRLPGEFAWPAGVGDVLAALGALALLASPGGPNFRRVLLGWNILGLLDFIVAIGTAGWMSATRHDSMMEMTRLPLAFVPLFVVPTLLATHLIIFRRYAGNAERNRSAELGEVGRAVVDSR